MQTVILDAKSCENVKTGNSTQLKFLSHTQTRHKVSVT